MRATAVAVVAGGLLLGACTSGAETRRARDPGVPDAALSPGHPYPFAASAPADRPTPIDGTYRRRLTIAEAGGQPITCRRCAPYRVDAGRYRLVLERGRFYVAFAPVRTERPCPTCTLPSPFTSNGHFVVSGDEIVFFNDATCTEMRGRYRWTLTGARLRLEVVDDGCPFGNLRSRFLTATPWIATA